MRRALTAIGAAMMSVAVVAAQQAPVFRARTALVRLDVVVVDADGHAVHGLSRGDFEVVDRGHPQGLAAFEEISHERAALSALPETLKLDVADNTISSPDRLIIVVLDDLHFQAKTAEVKAMARRVVSAIGPRASLALVTTSGSFGVEPTSDRAVVLSELDRFLDRFDPEGRRLAPGARAPDPTPIVNAIGQPVAVRGPGDPGRFFADLGALKTVEDVAKKIIGGVGRRNALVWISGGVGAQKDVTCDGSAGNAHYCGSLAGLMTALRKANVAAYSVATGDFNSALLKTVADASGGFVMNASDFDKDLPRLIDDLDHYYLLGFYPADEPDGRVHPVEVRATRPGLSVRYRSTYQAGEPPRPRNSGDLSRLSEGVLPVADLPLRVSAMSLRRPGSDKPVTVVSLEFRVARAVLSDPDGHLRDTLRYEVWAIDVKRKKALRGLAREARLDLTPAEAAAAPGDPLAFQVHALLALKPGRYQLRASATSARTGKGGSVFHEVEIPGSSTGIELGDIALGYADGARVPIVRGGTGVVLLPLPPTLDREFGRSNRLRLVCDVFKPAATIVDVTVDLLRADGAQVSRVRSQRLNPAASPRVDAEVPLLNLAPGGYRLRLTAADGTGRAEREIGFVVK